MNKLNRIIANSINHLLTNCLIAAIFIPVIAIMPFTAWLGLVLVVFITLRKGPGYSATVFMATIVATCVKHLSSLPVEISLLKGLMFFLPGYLLALVLRSQADWQAVAKVNLSMVLLASLLINFFAPETALAIFKIFETLVNEMQSDSAISEWLRDGSSMSHQTIANYLLGIQLLIASLSTVSALLVARYMQGRMFYPGGFSKELMAFRGERLVLVMMGFDALLALWGSAVALNVLPAFLFYFMFSGIVLCYHSLTNRRPLNRFILLFGPMLIVPYLILPLFLMFGTLDSLFNIRVYLSGKTE